MEIVCEGEAQIKHADTGIIYTIEADLLDWDTVGSNEAADIRFPPRLSLCINAANVRFGDFPEMSSENCNVRFPPNRELGRQLRHVHHVYKA